MEAPPKIVAEAACVTAIMVLGLTLFAVCTNTDFSRSLLGAAHCAVLLFSTYGMMFAWLIWGYQAYSLWIYLGIVSFGFYIIYDTQQIMGGNHIRFKFEEDDYILASIVLYLDIIQLFLYVLKALSEKK